MSWLPVVATGLSTIGSYLTARGQQQLYDDELIRRKYAREKMQQYEGALTKDTTGRELTMAAPMINKAIAPTLNATATKLNARLGARSGVSAGSLAQQQVQLLQQGLMDVYNQSKARRTAGLQTVYGGWNRLAV